MGCGCLRINDNSVLCPGEKREIDQFVMSNQCRVNVKIKKIVGDALFSDYYEIQYRSQKEFFSPGLAIQRIEFHDGDQKLGYKFFNTK